MAKKSDDVNNNWQAGTPEKFDESDDSAISINEKELE